jgi:cytochrome c
VLPSGEQSVYQNRSNGGDGMKYLFDYRVWGSLLGATLFVLVLGVISDTLVFQKPMKKPGYTLPSGESQKAVAKKPAAPAIPLAELLAKADPAKGKQIANVCTACHNFAKGAGTKVGPDLWGVVGRPKGKEPGFDYSDAMKAKGGDWTYADLNEFITKPQDYVPGTKMGFGGEANAQKRADIIVFLRTLSDNPVPLPPVAAAAPAKAAAPAPAPAAPAKAAAPAPAPAPAPASAPAK